MMPLLDRPRVQVGPVDDLTRREFVAGGLTAGLLAACGRDDVPQSQPSEPAASRMVRTPVGEVRYRRRRSGW